MRYLFLIFLTIVLSSCSLWPWRSEKTGTCLDDDSCQNADPLTQELIGGTWYCYGSDRDQPWGCSQTQDDQKIVSVPNERPLKQQIEEQAEKQLAEQAKEEKAELQESGIQSSDDEPQPIADLSRFPDDSYTVQLIALQTMEEVQNFAAKHNIRSPTTARIRSQGSDWYVVILGIYDTMSEAQTVASDWQITHNPSSKPWIRPLGPLKQAALAR